MVIIAALNYVPVAGAIVLLLLTGLVLFKALVTRQRHLVWLMILQLLMSLYLIAFHVNHYGTDLFVQWAMRLRSPIVLSLLPTFYYMIRSMVKDTSPSRIYLLAHYALPITVLVAAVIPVMIPGGSLGSMGLLYYSGLIITLQMVAYFVLYLVRFRVFMDHVHRYVGGDERRSIWLSRIFLFFSLLIIALDTGLISFFFKINEAPGLYALLLLGSVFLLVWQVMRSNYGTMVGPSGAALGSTTAFIANENRRGEVEKEGQRQRGTEVDVVVDLVEKDGEEHRVEEGVVVDVVEEVLLVKEVLSVDIRKELHRRVIGHISDRRVLSDSSLSLKKVAQDLQTNTKYVSLVINEFEQTSFPNYINKMRIGLVLELMADEENRSYTLFALGQMAGFKSKSTFIEAFKQQTGVTPSEYQRIK